MNTDVLLEKAHVLCNLNKSSLKKSTKCGCFFCLKIFEYDEIKEWIDSNENTALCPYCGIDSVIPESDFYQLDRDFLQQMYRYWFE